MACEVVAQTKEPLSRQSLADLVRRARGALRGSPGALRGENGDPAVWPTGGSCVGAGALPRGGAVVHCRG